MTVAELIAKLQECPADAEVRYLFDGCLRGRTQAVWLTNDGTVAIGAVGGEYVYDDDDRAVGSPTSADNRYLLVEEMLGIAVPDEDDD